jgi:hypothetical protein
MKARGEIVRVFFFVFILLLHTFSLAQSPRVSPKRPVDVSWEKIAKKLRPKALGLRSRSAIDEARPLPEVDFNHLENWESYKTISERFEKIRDVRFIKETINLQKLRRITWMYPDDGCYARASLINQNLTQMGVVSPTKIFVYGDLLAQTPNTTSGTVSWWYHVAPVVTDGKENYVLDPSLEPLRPLTVREWLERMGDPITMRVSVCSSDSYTPYSPCLTPEPDEDDTAMEDQVLFLSLERYRLYELGRDVDRELGDFPPWK